MSKLGYILTAGALLLLSFLLGRWSVRNTPESVTQTEVVEVIRRDTIRITEPILRVQRMTDTLLVAVRDTIRLRDTLYVSLPRQERTYSDSTYLARVSGYDPRLDYIEVYGRTTERTITQTLRPSRWGFSVTAGPSVLWSPFTHKVDAGLGVTVGVAYRFGGK